MTACPGGSLLIECRPRFNRSKGSSVIKGIDTSSMRHKSQRRVEQADKQPDINAVHDTEGGREKIEVEIIGIIKVSPEECQKLCELCGNVLVANSGENEGKEEHFLGNTSIQTETENYNRSIEVGRSFKAQGRSKSDYNWSFIRKDITDDKERVNSSKSARVVKRSSESQDDFTSIGHCCRQSVRSSHRSELRSESFLSEGSVMTTCDDNDDVDSSNQVTLGLDVEPSMDMRRAHQMNNFSAKDGGNMCKRKGFHIVQRVKTESSDSEYHVSESKKEKKFRASDMRKTLNIETYSEDLLSEKFNSGYDQKCLPYHFNDRKSKDSRHLVPEYELVPNVDRRKQVISGENNAIPSIKVQQTREDRRFIRRRVSHGRRIRLTDPTVYSRYCSASDGELPATAFPNDIVESQYDSVTYSLHENESCTDIEQLEIGTRTDKMKGNIIKNTRKIASFNYPEKMLSFDEDLAYKLTSRSKLLHDSAKRRTRAAVLKRKLRKQSEKQDVLLHNPTDDKCTTIRLRRSTSGESWVNQEHFPDERGRSYIKRMSKEDYSCKPFRKKIKKSFGDCNSPPHRNRRRKSFRRYETGEVQCASPLATTDYSEIDFFSKHSKNSKQSDLKGKLGVEVESRLHRNGKNKEAMASSSEEEIAYQFYDSGNHQRNTYLSMTNAKERAVMRERRIHNIPENNLKLSADVMSGSISATSTSLRPEIYDFEDQKINHNENNGRYESSHNCHSINDIIYPKSERRVKMERGLRDSFYEHMKCSSSDKLTDSCSYVSFSHYSTDRKNSYRIPERDEFLDCKTYDSMWKNLPQKRRNRGHSRDSRTCENPFRPSSFSFAKKHVKLYKEETAEYNGDQMTRQKYPVVNETVCRNVMISRSSQDEYPNSAGESLDFEGAVNGNANMRLKSNKSTDDKSCYDKSSHYETTSYTESVTANENSSAKDLKEEARIQVLPRSSHESKQFTGQELREGNPNKVLRARNLVCDREKNLKYTPPQERASLSATSMHPSVQSKRILYERRISELRSAVARNKSTARTIKGPSYTSLRKKITVEKKNIVPDLEKINSEKSRDEQFAIQEENTAQSQGTDKMNPDASTHDRAANHDIETEKANTSREPAYLNIAMTGKLARVSSNKLNNLGKGIIIEGKQSKESSHIREGSQSAFERSDFVPLNKKCSSLDNDCNISGRKNSGEVVKNNVGISFNEFHSSSLSERIEDWNRAIESVNKSGKGCEGTSDQKKSFSLFSDQEKENRKETIQSLPPVEGPCPTHGKDRGDYDEISEEPSTEIQSVIYATNNEVNGGKYSISGEHSSRNNLPFICKKEASTESITGSSQWESYQTEDTEDGAMYSDNKDSYRDRGYSTDRPSGGKNITRCNLRNEEILKKRANLGRFRLRKISTEGRYPLNDLCSYTIMEEEREDVSKDAFSLTRSTPIPERQHDIEYGKLCRGKRIIHRRKPKYFLSMLQKEANLFQEDASESAHKGISLKNLFVKSHIKGDDKQNSKMAIAFCKGTSVRYLGEVKQCGVQFAPITSINKKARETGLIQSKECYFKNCNRVKHSLLAPSTTDNLECLSACSYSTCVSSPLNENVVNENGTQKRAKYIPAIILLKERKQQYSRDQEGNKTGMRTPNVKRCGKCGKVKNNSIKKIKMVPPKKKRTRVAKKCV